MSTVTSTRVVIVEDQALLRQLLQSTLTEAGIEVVETFGSAEEASASKAVFDVAIVDIALPGQNGAMWSLNLKKERPEVGILLLSSHAYPGLLAKVPQQISAGWAYLLKDRINDPSELVRAITVVREGGIALDQSLSARAQPRDSQVVRDLTEGQWKLLALLSEGLSNDAIAERLVIAPKSVENAIGRLYVRLGINTNDSSINPRVAASRVFIEQSTYPI
jgi:DNA-binding NarL/FixJ family response regulator